MMEGIIFDCDGVLIDSEVIYLESLVEYLHSLNKPCTIADVQHVIGKPMIAIAESVREQFGLWDLSLEDQIQAQRAVFHERFYHSPLTPMAGLIEFLQRCRNKQMRIAVASSSSRQYVMDLLQRFEIEEYFDQVVTGEQVQNGKPAPDIFNLAAELLQIEKEKIMIIEDSCNGIKAGLAAGMVTIGFKGSKLVQDTSSATKEVTAFDQIEL